MNWAPRWIPPKPVPVRCWRNWTLWQARIDTVIEEMDFSFLYSKRRNAFPHRLQRGLGAAGSTNYYDLLASEARIASLVAITKGDVRCATGCTWAGR